MARYKVLVESYINDQIALPGDEVEFTGRVRPDIDTHLELIPGKANVEAAKSDAAAVEAALRDEAIKAALTEDGTAGGKPIDKDTPFAVVQQRLAVFKQSGVN